MKKLIISILLISSYTESSDILRRSMEYRSPQDQAATKKATFEIKNVDRHRRLKRYIDYLRTGEGEKIDWNNPEEKGLTLEDLETDKRWLINFYFDTPNPLELHDPKLPDWIDNEFDNITYEEALRLDTDKLGPVSIRKGVINFMMRKAEEKYFSVHKKYRSELSKDIDNYKKDFSSFVNQNLPKFQYIENIDTSKASDKHDFEYLVVKPEHLQDQAIRAKLEDLLKNNADVTVMLAFDDQTTAIDNHFRIPDTVSQLAITGVNVTSIGNSFLHDRTKLTAIDLSGIENVTSIGSGFLLQCEGLTSIDLKGLENVTSIGHGFLLECTGLTSIDLRPLKNVTSIGNYFLSGCTGLTSIDLRPLKNVTSISNDFISGCTGLTSIDLTPLENVTSIADDFLSYCTGLTSIDLTPLKNVTSIGNGFLYSCKGLTSIDLTPLKNVTSIDNHFLYGCEGLRSIDLSPLKNVTSIDNHFLYGCEGLRSIDLKGLENVTSIGNGFLSRCKGLTSIDLKGLKNVTSISNGFLSGCTGLTTIDLSPLKNVTSIGNGFISGCTGLTTIDLSPLKNVTSIGNHFLSECKGLTSIEISAEQQKIFSPKIPAGIKVNIKK